MILVDTSVMIKALHGGSDSVKVVIFDRILAQDVPFAICPYVYQETLQGIADAVTYTKVKSYLDTQNCLWLGNTLTTFEQAARLYWDLRRKGVTIRSTTDILIALTAIHNEAALLHDDRDFDHIAQHVPELTLLTTWK